MYSFSVGHVIRKANLHVLTILVLLLQMYLVGSVSSREYYGIRINPSVTGIPEEDKLNKMSNIRSRIECFSFCMTNSKCGMIIYSGSERVCILRKIKQLPGAPSFIDIPPNSIYTMLQAPECPTSDSYTYQPEFRLCYQINSNKMSWNNAADDCNEKRGQLIHIRNLEVMLYLQEKLKQWPDVSFHFGLCRDIDKYLLVWQNGEALTFGFWQKNRPDNYGGDQHCGVLTHYSNHRWNDIKCDDEWGYICEIVVR